MNTLRTESPLRTLRLLHLACEPSPAWEARGLTDLVPPATLPEARAGRDELRSLLTRERGAAADFLLALADFDRRRGWEQLGHASLFAFLTRELGLSTGAAQLRLSAARLLPRHPAVEEALRSGRLCISAVGQLARVLTPANEAEVLPRFLGRSTREAQAEVAAILPVSHPPRREVVTAVVPAPAARGTVQVSPGVPEPLASGASTPSAPAPLHTCEVQPTAPAPIRPASVEPLDADLRRLHLTVSRRLLEKIERARIGLSHALPHATTEQVLDRALDLLLEQQSRRKSLVRRPRGTMPAAESRADSATPTPTARPPIPAAIEREVRLRDENRCQFPLDAGGVCGSTWQVELDHVIPFALGGEATAANLRCACKVHNWRAAREPLGPAADARRG